MRGSNLDVVEGQPKLRCPECKSGTLVPTTMAGVTRCDQWPSCRYIAGLDEVRVTTEKRNRCAHRARRLIVRLDRYAPVEAVLQCESCARTMSLPSDLIVDYRNGTVRVLRVS